MVQVVSIYDFFSNANVRENAGRMEASITLLSLSTSVWGAKVPKDVQCFPMFGCVVVKSSTRCHHRYPDRHAGRRKMWRKHVKLAVALAEPRYLL